jgi:hypothetical protein
MLWAGATAFGDCQRLLSAVRLRPPLVSRVVIERHLTALLARISRKAPA